MSVRLFRHSHRPASIGLVFVLMVACAGEDALSSPPAKVASVAISPSSASVAFGATTQLSATTKDASGNKLTGRTVTWSSSSTSIAAVSNSGLVSGVSAGSATISATSEGQTATAQITVTVVPVATTSVTVTNDISFEPQHIKVAPGAAVTWTWAVGNVNHNVTFASSSITSSVTQSSGSFTTTMPTAAGVYDYVCTIHGIIMSGTVTVE